MRTVHVYVPCVCARLWLCECTEACGWLRGAAVHGARPAVMAAIIKKAFKEGRATKGGQECDGLCILQKCQEMSRLRAACRHLQRGR